MAWYTVFGKVFLIKKKAEGRMLMGCVSRGPHQHQCRRQPTTTPLERVGFLFLVFCSWFSVRGVKGSVREKEG